MVTLAIATIVIIAVVAIALIFIVSENRSDNGNTQPSQAQELVEVPSFTNKNYDDVIADKYYSSNFTFEKQETYSDTVEEGMIIKQSITPGSQAPKNSTIILTVSKGLEYVSFPSSGVVGVDYNAAKALLEKDGYKVSKVEKSNPGAYTPGVVYQASLDSGSVNPKGCEVILTVWGEPVTTEPSTEPSSESTEASQVGQNTQGIVGDILNNIIN